MEKTPLCPLSVVYGVECTPSEEEEEEEEEEKRRSTQLIQTFMDADFVE